MYDDIVEFVKEQGMLNNCDHVVIGLSGGSDSVCLFYVLHEMLRDRNTGLTAVHVHHGIRGAEADRDRDFCRRLCERYGVTLREFYFDVPAYAREHGMGEEEAGRMLRYEAFNSVASEYDNARIAVAHHMNDQAETVLYNMFRGSGIRGIRGMQPVSGNIIRPLLNQSKSDILEILSSRGFGYMEDSTNGDISFIRNKIRTQLIPYAERNINKQAVKNIVGLSQRAGQAEDYIERMTDEAVLRCVSVEKDGLLVKGLYEEDPYIIMRVMMRAISQVAGSLKDIGSEHYQRALDLINADSGTILTLRGGVTLRAEQDGIYIFNESKIPDNHASGQSEPEVLIDIKELADSRELVVYRGDEYRFELIDWDGTRPIVNHLYTKFFDYDKINGNLVLRSRRSGDYLVMDDAGHKKKLKDYFIDKKVPSRLRDEAALLAMDDHIVWVVGGRISNAFKITDTTKRVLVVTIKAV